MGRHFPSSRLALTAGLILASAAGLSSQAPAKAPASRTAAHVEYLASPALEGRLTGTPGADLAATYIERELKRLGAVPLPGATSFRVPFDFTAGVSDEGTTLEASRPSGAAPPSRWQDRQAVIALSFSDAATVSGPAVFAGYGLRVPGEKGFSYDSYAGLDVKDKIVVVLRYFPEDADRELRQSLVRYAGLRFKAMAARQLGARAIVVVTGPRSMKPGEVVPLTLDTAAAGSGIVAVSVNGAVAEALLTSAGKPLTELQQALDTGNPHVTGFELKGLTLSVAAKLTRKTATTHNLIGYFPQTTRDMKPKPWVMLGAHYDHLGRGAQGTSLARNDEQAGIHHGADDNASGVAAVLAAAETLKNRPRARHVALAFWSGEEIGLVGSGAYVAKPSLALDQLAAYLNFDMVGRLSAGKLAVQATGSSPLWPALVTKASEEAKLTIVQQPDPHLPTDSSSFNQAGVPTLAFFTGSHEDYHRPSDVASKIDTAGIDRIASFAISIVDGLAGEITPPQFTKVEQTTQGRGGREGMRISTGTIPDYASSSPGLLLGGVVGGGPAEQAGLQKGDIIVELAGQKITNIYDYTYALDLMKPDQPVKVVYLRGAEKRETTLTPRARK